MKSFIYRIKDPVGLHARPAGMVVNEVKKYRSKVRVIKGERSADASGLMMLMALGIRCDDEVTVEVSGTDEEEAAGELLHFFEENL